MEIMHSHITSRIQTSTCASSGPSQGRSDEMESNGRILGCSRPAKYSDEYREMHYSGMCSLGMCEPYLS